MRSLGSWAINQSTHHYSFAICLVPSASLPGHKAPYLYNVKCKSTWRAIGTDEVSIFADMT